MGNKEDLLSSYVSDSVQREPAVQASLYYYTLPEIRTEILYLTWAISLSL